MQGISLPTGVRFLPSEEDLLEYLQSENSVDRTTTDGTIVCFDVYSCEPWHLPGNRFLYSDRQKDMYFFSRRSSTKDGGRRASRRAGRGGTWHNHSKVKHFLDANGNKIGEKRTFNYVKDSVKTEWIMHEYLLQTDHNHKFEDKVLCHIYEKADEKNTNGKNKDQVAKRSRSEEEEGGGGRTLDGLQLGTRRQEGTDASSNVEHHAAASSLSSVPPPSWNRGNNEAAPAGSSSFALPPQPAAPVAASCSSDDYYFGEVMSPAPLEDRWDAGAMPQREGDIDVGDIWRILDEPLLLQENSFASSSPPPPEPAPVPMYRRNDLGDNTASEDWTNSDMDALMGAMDD